MAKMPPKMRMYKGDVAAQADAVFKKNVAALKEAGLTPADAFFSRNILYPDPKNGGDLDFGAFNAAYTKVYNNPENPNRLARTVMSAPGYAAQGQLIAVETYAVYPGDAAKNFLDGDKKVPLRAFRSDKTALGSSGVATSPEAALTFLSGLTAKERGDMKTEAASVLALAKEKLAKLGATLDNTVQLRAYLANGDDVSGGVQAFEAAYAAAFTGEHRPALTILPVKAAPGGARLEMELLVATLP
jgi:enamine deaminase RidA (YjgF/YER057c/UK114 family)